MSWKEMSNENAWVAFMALTVVTVAVAMVAFAAIRALQTVESFDKDCTRWEAIPEQTTNCAVDPNGFGCNVSITTRVVCTGREKCKEGE